MTSERALATLEFPAVRALLAERTAFLPGRELAEGLVPAASLAEAERLQDETAAGRALGRAKPAAGLTGARDIRHALRRAALGGALDPEQLLEVGQTVRAAERLFADVQPYPPLAGRTRFAPPPVALAVALEQAIGSDATVLDRASPALGGLRGAVRGAQSRLQQRVDGILRSGEVARFLQDPIVTQRGGRYVVPVKAEHRGAVKGIVHDQSASGQTVFIEPLEVLEANNALREAELAERTEVARILDALSRRVEAVGEELRKVLEALAAVDLILAKAALAEAEEAERPRLNAQGVVDLIGARHPLLVVVAKGAVVPVDVRLGSDFRVLVVTGPNTGGKTVTLKTIGLLTLMASAGLQVPAAAGTELPVIPRVFADIGDEQSIAQSLSTFSSHLRNVVATLAEARAGDLAFLDELGAGTDPDQGAALAMAVLETLLARGVLVAATTHYPELKAFALNTPGVSNASVEFDAATLRPTYRVRVGLPGASQAFAIAAHLGLDPAVLALAEGHLSDLHRSLERTLREAERHRTALATSLEEQRIAAEDARAATAAATREAQAVVEEARAAMRRARAEADEVVLRARRALRSAEEARERPGRRDLVDEARAALASAEAVRQVPALPVISAPSSLVVGQRVTVEGTTEPGTLLAIDGAGMAEVAVGAFRLRAPVGELRPVANDEVQPLASAKVTRNSAPPPPLQLDIRGARAEEALAELERYLNDAALSGYDRIRIVHGKGTGALRLAVRAALGAHPLVRGYEPAGPSEGGDGATIVTL